MKRVRAGRAAVFGLACVVAVSLAGCASSAKPTPTPSAPATYSADLLVPADAHYLMKAAADAPTLVVFWDFQCPYCGRMDRLIARAEADYAGKINIVARNFPLKQHPYAFGAAQAAEAAANQGQLQQMATLLFERQAEWGASGADQNALFLSYATQLGLDTTRFIADMNSDQVKQRINRDMADGAKASIRQVPALYLNGAPLSVDSSRYETIKIPVDAALSGN